MKTQKGITLIALVITIIVMLILVAVSVTVALNGGLFNTANQAKQGTAAERDKELALSDERVKINEIWYDSMDDYLAKKPSDNQNEGEGITPISEDTDCVGYYVDLGGEEGPEGVIYIDLANTEDGSWNEYSYTIPDIEGELKEYYISDEEYTEGPFGPAPVLSLVSGTKGEERFYVMSLEDCKKTINETDNTTFFWYINACIDGISEYETLTATGVGEGEANTSKMLTEWNAPTPTYGAKGKDIWEMVEDGWYIPSKDEWAAFGSAFDVSSKSSDKGYYDNFDLSITYWTSSLEDPYSAWDVYFNTDSMYYEEFNFELHVRLGTTF